MAIRINNAMRSVIADYVTAYLSGSNGTTGNVGRLCVYSGTQPGTAGGTSGTMLVQIDGISWNAAVNGTAGISASKTGTAGSAGTAGWARLSGTDGTSYIIDGDCGMAAQDFVIDVVDISESTVVTLTAATIMQPAE